MRLIDLCAILTVVGFSFIFTLKETKYVNNQLLFIVSSLIVILFYKLMNYNKIEKELNQLTQQKNNNQVNNQVIEQFNNSVEGQVNGLITKILTFIEGTDQGTTSEPIQRSEEIVDLSKNVEDLKQLLTILASDKNISTSFFGVLIITLELSNCMVDYFSQSFGDIFHSSSDFKSLSEIKLFDNAFFNRIS